MNHYRILTGNLAMLAIAVLTSISANAQSWPTKFVTIVAPGGPGGTTDIFARLLAVGLPKELGQAVIVENRAGAGTNIGSQYVAQAKPDGYTLLIGAAAVAVNPHLYKSLAYNPQRDLEPIRLIARIPNVIAVHANGPRNLKELIELLRANPGKYNYASGGAGTMVHLGTELFKSMTQTDIVGVQYKSSALAVSAVLAGEVLVAFENIPVVLPHVKAGTLRALAVTANVRSKNLPDVPTLAEAGLTGYDVTSWFGLFAPTGTPSEAIKRLDAATLAYLQSADAQEKLRAMGAMPATEGPEAFRAMIRAESEKWGAVIRKAKIQAD